MSEKGKRFLICLPEWSGRNHSFFLGACDLRSFLRNHGLEVEIFDEDVSAFAAEQEKKDKEAILRDALLDFRPNYVGIHINTPNYESALKLARKIRLYSPESIIVAGGPHASVAWKTILEFHNEIDYISVGEGETSILSLVTFVSAGMVGDLPPGIAGRYNGEVRYKPEAFLSCEQLVASDRQGLLEPPFPDLRKWARKRYLDNFYNAIYSFDGRNATNIYVARGCTRKCPYCSPGSFWKDPFTGIPCQRIKSFDALESELLYLRENGFSALYFDEMAIPMKSGKWLQTFAELLKKYDFFWGGAVLFDQISKVSVETLANYGLRYLYFGFETPQDGLQSEIGKKTNNECVSAFMKRCASCGIQCDLSMFFGIPGENDKTVENTISWLLSNLPRGNAFFSVAAIWPGTPWADDFGLAPICWEPEYIKGNAPNHVNWYSHDMTAIGKFYSNALGTYHPPYLTPEKALWIKQKIIESGFRERFAKYSRRKAI